MKSLIAGVLLAAPVMAHAYTWTDVYDAGPAGLFAPQYISQNSSATWTFDITDASSGGFQAGMDHINSFAISLFVSDDQLFDGAEMASLAIDGANVGGSKAVPLFGSLTYKNSATINWLASLNVDGLLSLSLTSTLGDFYFYGATLDANGDKGRSTSVPEPSSIALLAAGLLGIAAMRRKSNLS